MCHGDGLRCVAVNAQLRVLPERIPHEDPMTDPNAAPPAAPEKAGLIEDFVDIFTSPSAVFTRRANASALLPWLIVSALLVLMLVVNRNIMAGITDAMMNKGFAAAAKANPNVTAEQMASSRGMMENFGLVSQIIGVPIGLLVVGLFTWIIGKIFGATFSYGTALMVTSFAWIPRVVEQVLLSVQGLVIDTSTFTSPYQVSLGAMRFMDSATMHPALVGVLSRLDIITIWVVFLTATGLVYAGKMERKKMMLAAVVIWLVGTLPAIYGAFKAVG